MGDENRPASGDGGELLNDDDHTAGKTIIGLLHNDTVPNFAHTYISKFQLAQSLAK